MAITPVCERMYSSFESLGSDQGFYSYRILDLIMNINEKIAQKHRRQKRLVFFIRFAIFQTAGHVFYALDRDAMYLPGGAVRSGPTTEWGRLEDKTAWSPPM